jgi:hypothetical protein
VTGKKRRRKRRRRGQRRALEERRREGRRGERWQPLFCSLRRHITSFPLYSTGQGGHKYRRPIFQWEKYQPYYKKIM